MRWLLGAAILTATILACGNRTAATKKEITVAAASDLAGAFEELGPAFTKATGIAVNPTLGSTGQLAKQLAQGAPYDAFLAANIAFLDEAIAAGACALDSKALYAQGNIVVWTRKAQGAPPALAALAEPSFAKIAIANPDHAPYGVAAKQALQHAGIWETIYPRLVFGENIRQTLQYAQSGNVDAAIVALALAQRADDGTYALIDPSWHQPLEQAAAACTRGANADGGRAFVAFLISPAGQAILAKYGFAPPPGIATAKP